MINKLFEIIHKYNNLFSMTIDYYYIDGYSIEIYMHRQTNKVIVSVVEEDITDAATKAYNKLTTYIKDNEL